MTTLCKDCHAKVHRKGPDENGEYPASLAESENHDIELGMPWPDWVNDCELLSNFNADSHGRVNLGPEYGDATVRVAVIEVVDDGDAD
jgi:hypothetical protein